MVSVHTESEERVLSILHNESDQDLEVLERLVAASIYGDGEIQRIVSEEFASLGCLVETFEADLAALAGQPEFTLVADLQRLGTKGRPNVVGRLPGSAQGRTLLIFAHPDSYDLRSETWATDPYTVETASDGRAYGYGISDDRSGIVAMILAMRALRKAKIYIAGDVMLASVLGKHFGAGGTLALMERCQAFDGAVYVHPAETGRGLVEFKPLTLGLVQFQITTYGCSGPFPERLQTPGAHLGISAIRVAMDLIHRLEELGRTLAERWPHPTIDRCLGRSANVLISCLRGEAADRQVPLECSLTGSLTFPPGLSVGEIRQQVEDVVTELQLPEGVASPRVEWLPGYASPAETDLDSPLITTFQESVALVTGEKPSPWPGHTASDIRFPIIYSSTPTVGFGPKAGNFGGPDEWLDTAEFRSTVASLAIFIMRWCGVDSQRTVAPSKERI